MNLSFNIGDKVQIPELETYGRVVSIWVQQCGIQYEVRYFLNGEAKNVFFFENEIEIYQGVK